jgi:hypothetical protein
MFYNARIALAGLRYGPPVKPGGDKERGPLDGAHACGIV